MTEEYRTGVNGQVIIDPNEILGIERDTDPNDEGVSVLLWPGRWRIRARSMGGGGGSTGGSTGSTAWADITGKPSAYPPSTHSHPIAEVTGLQAALDGKQAAGSYAAASHAHTWSDVTGKPSAYPPEVEATQDIIGGMVAAAGGTYDDAAGTITLPSGGGGGAVSSVAGRTGDVVLSSADLTDAASLATDAELTAGLAEKANTTHTHTIANVTGLQTALDGKQPAGSYAASAHTHAPADITGTAVITTDPRLSDARTPTAHTHPASAISDSTATGRSVLTAADATAARTAIGAGTSSLAIGTTGTTAAAGNRQATETAIGMVELATTAEATTGTDTTRAVTPAGLKAGLDTKAASTHSHTPAQIGTGTPAAGTYVDGGTGAWTALPSGGGGVDTEAVQDIVGAMVTGAGGTYDDTAGTITLPSGGGGVTVPTVYLPGAWIAPPGYPILARDIAVQSTATRYYPMRIDAPLTLTNVAIVIATLAAGPSVHVALYRDPTGTAQPGQRIALPSGAGFDGATAGTKEASGLTIALTPGNYVWVVGATGGSPTLLGYRVAVPWLGTSTGNYLAERLERNSGNSTMPPPDPGEPWTGIGTAANLFLGCLWLKVVAA